MARRFLFPRPGTTCSAEAGNVLDVPEAAFRTRSAWHALSFRCEVDTDATTILSLSFRVGATIARDQWARLGLPADD
ncbi:DUF930 domain-containing protein [Aminobacter sp. MSH1]|uniref:DUF930 domain-containing protein n=1 Tax=Aminobacter sp. MSH1 TaxID=374606 RepID=UPI001FDED582|nr:DUF930 domain-containing protein [Aminobacter sp. MSH1]